MSTLKLTETQALALQALLYREEQLPPALQEVLAALPLSRDLDTGIHSSSETSTKRKESESLPTSTHTFPSPPPTLTSLLTPTSVSTSTSTSTKSLTFLSLSPTATATVIDNTPAEPSKDVTTDMTMELGRITLGTQTSVGSTEYLSWVTVLKSMMEGTLNNIRDMAVSSLVDGTARFVRMLNELYFAAKVNSRLNLTKIKENSLRPRPTAIFQTLQSHDIPIQKSREFLLAVIAFKGEDNYFRKKASVTVIQALCNQIRAPTSSGEFFVHDSQKTVLRSGFCYSF
ncbi:hypothetical protein F5877DRAFT_73143 [Lentinula edodes]|nr:hypothetical protein F5877DRAFT_73143 [Lentinula edodes]